MKTFDLFLSHSSLDSEVLLKLKAILNSDDIHVYVDWFNDREALKWEMTNVDTIKVIMERLKSSKTLLYVYTVASLMSRWMPWDLGYFHALKGKICVYYPETAVEKVPYWDIYPEAVMENEHFYVKDAERGKIKIGEWIQNACKRE